MKMSVRVEFSNVIWNKGFDSLSSGLEFKRGTLKTSVGTIEWKRQELDLWICFS
jgi:hypothetical protein